MCPSQVQNSSHPHTHTQGEDFKLKQRSFLGFARECKLNGKVRFLCVAVVGDSGGRVCLCVWEGGVGVCVGGYVCVCGRVEWVCVYVCGRVECVCVGEGMYVCGRVCVWEGGVGVHVHVCLWIWARYAFRYLFCAIKEFTCVQV